MIHLDAVQTVAFAGLTLFAGYALCRAIPFFRRYNLPEPVVGGLLVALAVWWAHGQQTTLFELDTTLKTPLMVAFFTTLGINASLRLLRVSGKQVMLFLLIGSLFAVLQNL
ncbi:MAG: sodium/glutamate symporter, partial [Stenotrophomonas sp.]